MAVADIFALIRALLAADYLDTCIYLRLLSTYNGLMIFKQALQRVLGPQEGNQSYR